MSDFAAASQPWYRSLGRAQWNTLIASNLGWVFDGYETYALVISVGVALRHRLRMGDRHLDRVRALARQEPRQGCRADAMRLRHRLLPGLVRVALHQPAWPRCLAHHVSARRCSGAADAVDQASDP